MIKIILILALLQYISNFIFGYKFNSLNCGIFGQATNTPKNLDVNGVHILGIYNIERGKMSCGLSWDGDVQYGIGFDKLYTDFIVDREIKPVQTPIMIGHTRQPSYGMAINKHNAHPFGFGANKNNDSYGMIFCHNGTLKNHDELAKKYNIEVKVSYTEYYSSGGEYQTTRIKIDSEILGEILYKTKNFKVLSEYVGAAALAWTWIDEPNKLYLWSGASKHTQGSLINTETEERPMNVYSKDKNNIFFSSLKNGLMILGAKAKDKTQIDYNTVYIITDGDFENAEKHKISRRHAGQNEAFVYSHNYEKPFTRQFPDIYDDQRSFNKINNAFTTPSLLTNLHNDTTVHALSYYKDAVYSKSLRYWSGEVLISGVFVHVKNYGFKFISLSLETAKKTFKSIQGLTFNYITGYFNYNKFTQSGDIIFDENLESVPFYYFVDGVLLKNHSDYIIASNLKRDLKFGKKYVDFISLSHMSKHPVINLEVENTPSIAMLDGKQYDGTFTELGFEKIYSFNNGVLTKWSKREDLVALKTETPVIILPESKVNSKFNLELFENSISTIKRIEEDFIESEKLENKSKELDYEQTFIQELIAESFEKHSEDIDETILEFADWCDNEDIKSALNTLSLINHTLKDFIENPIKK